MLLLSYLIIHPNLYLWCLLVRFGENISTDPGHVDIYPVSRIPKQIHHLLTPIHRFTSGTSGGSTGSWGNMKEKGFRIITEPRTLVSVLHCAADEEVAFSLFTANIYGILASAFLKEVEFPYVSSSC